MAATCLRPAAFGLGEGTVVEPQGQLEQTAKENSSWSVWQETAARPGEPGAQPSPDISKTNLRPGFHVPRQPHPQEEGSCKPAGRFLPESALLVFLFPNWVSEPGLIQATSLSSELGHVLWSPLKSVPKEGAPWGGREGGLFQMRIGPWQRGRALLLMGAVSVGMTTGWVQMVAGRLRNLGSVFSATELYASE